MGCGGGAAYNGGGSYSFGSGSQGCSGVVAYNGAAACDRVVQSPRGVRPFAVVVTRSFPEIFPQLSDRFNHTNTRASCKKPPTKEHLSQSVIFFCAHQIAIFHLFDRQHRHSPDR